MLRSHAALLLLSLAPAFGSEPSTPATGQVVVTCDQPCLVELDGQEIGSLSPPDSVALKASALPGTHVLRVLGDAGSQQRIIELAAGESQTFVFVLGKAEPPEPVAKSGSAEPRNAAPIPVDPQHDASPAAEAKPVPGLEPVGDGMVWDPVTELVWQTSPGTEDMSWARALRHCKDLRFGGFDDWRRPRTGDLVGFYRDRWKDVPQHAFGTILWASDPPPSWARRYGDEQVIGGRNQSNSAFYGSAILLGHGAISLLKSREQNCRAICVRER